MLHLMTAEEARQKAIDSVTDRVDREIARTADVIEKAANNGDFEADTWQLLPVVQEKLMRLGYQVGNIKQGCNEFTRINWG